MKRALVLLLAALLLVPGAQARMLKVEVIQDKSVQGEEEIGQGNYVVTGNISISTGGLLRIRGAQLEFAQQSPGIYIEPGGILDVAETRFISSPGEFGARGGFRIVAAAGSTLLMTGSEVSGGQGVVIRSNDTEFSGNNVSHNEVGLFLDHVNITVDHNEFFDNVVALNATGGDPEIVHNRFVEGVFCIKDWRSDPDIQHNVFASCLFGIWHEESNSTLSFNQMQDRNDPGGIGIYLLNAQAPTVEGNHISEWGIGIKVTNSGGFIHDNWIESNVFEGILVESQNDTLEIVNNTVERNGAAGVAVDLVYSLPMRANRLRENGGSGFHAENATGLVVRDNDVSANLQHGIALVRATGAVVDGNDLDSNAATGIVVGSGSPGSFVGNNTMRGPHMRGLEAHGDDTTFLGNTIDGALHTGAYVTGANVTLDGGEIRNGRAGLLVSFATGLVARDLVVKDHDEIGIALEGASGARFDRVESSRNEDGWVFRDTDGVVLSYAKALANRDDGLRNEQGAPPVSTYGHYEDNGIFGVHNLGSTLMDATSSYWGSSSGPTSPLNPGGTGDRVSSGVLFTPFLTSPPS